MNRLFAVKPLLVVTAALAIALVLACGGRGETTSPGSLLRLLPQNADSFTFADLEQLRDERLDSLDQQLASLIGEGRLDDWGIDLDDASSLVLSDPNNGDALIILRGRFVAEDVEDALDDDGLRDSVHRDVTVWSERSGGVALAFVGEDVIVIGGEERVEDSIDVFIDEARSMDQDDEAETIVDALEDALVYSVAEDCGYRACRRQGSAVSVEAGDLVAVFAFLFRNDDAAADAEGDIADDLEDLVDDPRTEADGEMVIAESPVDENQLGLDRNGALAYRLEGDGSTPGRGGEERPTPTTERPRFGDDHGDDRSGATRIRDGEFLDGDIERDGDRTSSSSARRAVASIASRPTWAPTAIPSWCCTDRTATTWMRTMIPERMRHPCWNGWPPRRTPTTSKFPVSMVRWGHTSSPCSKRGWPRSLSRRRPPRRRLRSSLRPRPVRHSHRP